MDIEVRRNHELSGHDTGGGTREVRGVIEIDSNLHPREQRHVLIYETLGCCLDYVLPHQQLEDLADTISDALDQLDPIGGE